METMSRRRWLKTTLFHTKSPNKSSDCVIECPPPSNVDPGISNDVLVTAADASRSLIAPPTCSTEDSRTFPRLSPITKKGKAKSAEGELLPSQQNGLYLIYEPPSNVIETISPEKQCPIDIVAVHGMMGDAYKTWTHSNGHFWLRDSLPEEVPGARIFSYGYPAKVFLSLEQGRIDDHAITLLEELLDVRRGTEEQKRPIVFICHSMGGIVVKKAINKTVVESSRYSKIRTSTAAIFFLATPHCGSDPTKMLSVCTDILNIPLTSTGIARFSGKPRSDMIKALAPGSTTLLDISSDFKEHPGNIRIFSFIEQKSTPPISRKIVDDMSGLMFVSGEVKVPMPGCDHREVARFEGKESSGYKKIINKLSEVTSEITNKMTVELAAEDLPCLHTLSFPSMTSRLSKLTSQLHTLPRTCTWILSHPSFLAFHSSPSTILWIKGHPGTGKSTLMSFLIQHYQDQPIKHRQILLSFFFHGNGSLLEKSCEGMFRSLLIQLYKQSISARRSILAAFNTKKENTTSEREENAVWTRDELQTLFFSIVSSDSMREKEVIIIVDAIDEAVDETNQKAAPSLQTFFRQINDSLLVKGWSNKICIACREYPVVAVSRSSLQISIQDSNRQDIARYVSHQLRNGVEGWELQLPQVRTDLENAIVDKADGVFLWVVKRLERIIVELNDGSSSFADIQRLVESESNELFALYEDIFGREIKESARKKARLFLGWVCLAERPLSLTEIRIAMACDETCLVDGQDRIEESKNFVEDDGRMQRLVRSLSGGLAEVRLCAEGSTVQLIHQTVNEFLRERGLKTLFCQTGNSKAVSTSDAEDIGRMENSLSRACFNYLKLGNIANFSMTFGIAPVPTVQEVEERFPFIRYAVTFCFLHAQRAENLGISQEDLPALVDHAAETKIFQIEEGGKVNILDHPPSIYEIWTVTSEASRRLYEHPLVQESRLIHTAASYNLQTTVRYLVEKRGQLEAKDYFGETPLYHAIRGGHYDLVRWLLDAGADIEAKTVSSSTPLELAIKSGHDRITHLLLDRGADMNKPTGQFSNALEAACKATKAKGQVKLIEHLIHRGADIDGKGGTSSKGGTSLEEAANAGNVETVRLLIERGADIHAGTDHYGSPLQAAAQDALQKSRAVIEFLLQQGAEINAQGGQYGNALQAAARFASIDVIELLLDNGADVNAWGGYYGVALQAACERIVANEDAVKLLLSRGADVNAQGGHYGSPLQAAASSGDFAVFKMLVEKGAKVDIKGGHHQNMIVAAAAGGSPEIIQLLLDRGADINQRGGPHDTALQTAVVFNPEPFVEFLLDKGAEINHQGGFHGNALCAAVWLRSERMVELLLKRGADVHACAPGNPSALQLAVKRGNAKNMKALLEHGNDINAQMSGMLKFFRA